MKELSQIAEKKIVELKMALDKRTLENQDLQSQMQQTISHMNNFYAKKMPLWKIISISFHSYQPTPEPGEASS